MNQPKLLGLLPFMKFASFPAPDAKAWPNNSFFNWFKSSGPPTHLEHVSCLKDLAHLFPAPVSLEVVSPSSSDTATPKKPSSPPLRTSPAVEEAVMANIPIDPRPFVPRGFQILHVEGRTAFHRVVCCHRQHEEYAIASIFPIPAGQIPFENIRVVM